jgi:hypothetical protein
MKTKAQERIENKEKRKLANEKERIIKNLKKEMAEVDSVQSPKVIYYMNLKMIKKILMVYFDILKNKKDSKLMKGVFTGIGILCENINVEILLDLQKRMYQFINHILSVEDKKKNKNPKILFALSALKSSLSITEKLTKDIISVEDSNLIDSTYHLLCKLSVDDNVKMICESTDDLFVLIEIIEAILLTNRQFSLDVTAAYVKRLCMFVANINQKSEKAVSAFLLLIKRILQRYPSLNSLLDKDAESPSCDIFNYNIHTDPSLTNGKLSNISEEIEKIKQSHQANKLIKQLCVFISKSEKSNPILSSLNYFDLLIS